MRVLLPRRRRSDDAPGVTGAVRMDRSTRALASRLRPGDVAVLDHLDLDRASAERLLARGVAAVVNVAPSLSGRRPAFGAETLVAAGVPVLDAVGPDVLGRLREGQRVRIDLEDGVLIGADGLLARGVLATPEGLRAGQRQARGRLAGCLDTLVADAADLLGREAELLLEGPPGLTGLLDGPRPVLVVTDDPRAGAELVGLRRWCRRHDPVVLVVGAGCPAALAAGLRVDLLVGDLVGVEEREIRRASVVLATSAEAVAQAESAGTTVITVVTELPPVAVALAVVAAGAAPLVVAAGLPAGLDDLLDGGRALGAATLLGRLRLEGRLLDARAVGLLTSGHGGPGRAARGASVARSRGAGVGPALLVLIAGLLAALAVMVVSGPGQALVHEWLPGLRFP